MLPNRGHKKSTVSPPLLPLAGCVVTLSGEFREGLHANIRATLEGLGAETSRILSKSATHLISSWIHFRNETPKVKKAKAQGVIIVRMCWLHACVRGQRKEPEQRYFHWQPSLLTTTGPSSAGAALGQTSALGKRPTSHLATGTEAPITKKAKKGNDKRPKARISDITVNQHVKSPYILKLSAAAHSVDSYLVRIDEDGLIWDALLNQAKASGNVNKYFHLQVSAQPTWKPRKKNKLTSIQLIQDGSNFKLLMRWGCVGHRGNSQIFDCDTLNEAISWFQKKFKEKSGLDWDNRDSSALPGRYAFIEQCYNPEVDDKDGNLDDLDDDLNDNNLDDDNLDDDNIYNTDSIANDRASSPQMCTLEPPVQELMGLIFNEEYFAASMMDMGYNSDQLPLGKLSKTTISRGFNILNDLAALLEDPSLGASKYRKSLFDALVMLSNIYFSQIPHSFTARVPVIQDFVQVKREITLLENLGDMKDAELMKRVGRAGGMHPLDKQFGELGMKEMMALHPSGTEFAELAAYLMKTCGATHNTTFKIEHIFRIQRQGEKVFSGVSPEDSRRRLLWHGSGVPNFASILSLGLRIPPSEAPLINYMFGKGIYFADMASKSAGYCCPETSGGTALLLLCDVELGAPVQMLKAGDHKAGERAIKDRIFSTWGQGQTGPISWKEASVVHRELAGAMMVRSCFVLNPPLPQTYSLTLTA